MADDDDLVTVYETDLRERIAMAEYAFGEAGIAYIATNSTISVVYPVDGMAIVRFQVRRGDVERALEVIDRLNFESRSPSTGVERAAKAVRLRTALVHLDLEMAAPDARARLRDVLARAEGPIRGSWDGDELELSTSSLVAGRCTGRVRITPRGAGSELECTPASGLLQWLAVPAGLAVAALYLLRPRPAGGGMRAVSTGPLGPFLVGLSILVLTVLAWVAIVRRRQRARLRDFLCEVFEDVTRPEAEADDRAG